jgi:hypothetical protein
MIHISLAVQIYLVMPHLKHHKRHAKSHPSIIPSRPNQARTPHEDNLTYQNRRIRQKKNPTQTFQPTPVFSAMRSIRFIVPRKRFRVPSNWSFIFSARAVESLISPPIAFVNYNVSAKQSQVNTHRILPTYLLQHAHLPTHNPNLLIVLALQLIKHRIRILALLVRSRSPKPSVPTAPPALSKTI